MNCATGNAANTEFITNQRENNISRFDRNPSMRPMKDILARRIGKGTNHEKKDDSQV